MNRKQRSTRHALFTHPISGSIDARPACSMREALGAEVTHGGHGHVVVRLNGQTHAFHDPRHPLSKDEVVTRREFLETAGIDPVRDFPLDATAACYPGME